MAFKELIFHFATKSAGSKRTPWIIIIQIRIGMCVGFGIKVEYTSMYTKIHSTKALTF